MTKCITEQLNFSFFQLRLRLLKISGQEVGYCGIRAERKFRRVQGYRELPRLVAVLQQKDLDRKEMAA